MSKSSVNRYFTDFKDDGVCISSSNISTKSFTRKRSSGEFLPTTELMSIISKRNEDLNQNLLKNLSRKQIQQLQQDKFKPIDSAYPGKDQGIQLGEKSQRSKSNVTPIITNKHKKQYKRAVSFDSDVESDPESSDEDDELSVDITVESIKHDETKCGQRCLICSHAINSRKFPYRTKFKLIVMGLKLLQVVLSLLWTLTTYLEPHLNHWVQGRFKWISYICLLYKLGLFFRTLSRGLYFFLYFTIRFIGCLHGYWKLVTIFVIFTLSLAHATAVTSISTGSLMMPVVLGIILFIGLNYFVVTCRAAPTDDRCMSLYSVGVAIFITIYFCGIVISIYMGSLHVDKGTAFNKEMASTHCALVIGSFYGVYIIYEIRMFLDGRRLILDGVRDDYILAAVAI